MNYILDFSNIVLSPILGGKANKLVEMYQQGFQVPFGGVLLPEAFRFFVEENPKLGKAIKSFILEDSDSNYQFLQEEIQNSVFPEKLENELKSFQSQLQQQQIFALAVRSSGALEDGNSTSFAGQFESYLNIQNFESLKTSILHCWTSLFGKKVVAYCKNNGIKLEDFSMSVVIQQQIFSEYSGVVFTVNPLTGNDKQMVIEAVSGVGEALVQGNIIPDSYLYDWYNEELEIERSGQQLQQLVGDSNSEGLLWKDFENSSQLLNENQIRELSQKCIEVQQFYGEPLDIEWAISNGKIFILQARPLTSIHFKVDYEWTTADLKDGGISSSITTPMMYTLYEYIFENTMPAYFDSIRILPKKKFNKWFNWWFGFSYWNMLAAKEGVKQIPGFNERNFDKSLGIEPDYEGNGHVTGFTPKSIFKGIQILLATNKSIAKRAGVCKKDIQFAREFFEEIEKIYRQNHSLSELLNFFKPMIEDTYLHIEGSYFFTIYDNSNAATFCQEAIDKTNKKRKEKISYLNLVAGLSNLSHMRPTYELWDLCELIKQDANALKFYSEQTAANLQKLIQENQPFPLKDELLRFIEKFKYHSLRELDIMVPNWDEDPRQLLDLLLNFISNPNIQNPKLSLKKQNESFTNEKKKLNSRSLLKKLTIHRHLLWWREEMRDYSSKMYYHIRKILLLIGEKMVQENLLKEVDDVFFLQFQELIEYADTKDKTRFQTLIEKNKIFYRSYRNFRNPNEIWQKRDFSKKKLNAKSNDHSFQGIAGSHGHVVAKAVVIETIFDADKIKDGDILVTKFTDPAWTIYFARISGLVTESGGMLSHGAVVSREYGIPAILGLNNITTIIKTGDLLEIDGDSGEVTILKD